eukprot:gene7629-10386_t
MATFVKKNQVPETVIGSEGSAKRNILRKGVSASHSKDRKEGSTGRVIDDGSFYEDPSALDERDPNYDSEEDTGDIRVPALLRDRYNIGKSKLTLTSYKRLVEPIITEFFSSDDIGNVADSLIEIDAPEYSYEFVKRLINMSLDRNDREKESVSRLLNELYPDILSSNVIGKGFERLFEIVDEIEIDCPSARVILSTYLARAVMDEVLPPSFLNDAVICNLGGDIVEHAKRMLSRDHAGAMLEKIWGPGDGRPVEEMKVVVDQLIEEFLLSNDLSEAIRCVVEINAPQFLHEIVKRAVNNVMDKDRVKHEEISGLFKHLSVNEILTTQQAVKGFNRLHHMLPDISLDTPAAKEILHGFTQRAIRDKVLPGDYVYTPTN